MGRTEVDLGPLIDPGKPGVEEDAEVLLAGPTVEDADLIGAQSARAAYRVINPPDRAQVEDVPGSLAVTEGEGCLAPDPALEVEFPGRLAASVSVDLQVVYAREGFDGRRDGPKGLDDLVRDQRQSRRSSHGAIVELLDGQMEMDDGIERILARARTIAVVGLSPDPQRPSHGVARYLQRVGYRIIPVNPLVDRVLGEAAYASLRDVPERVDVVDVFRRSEFVAAIVDDAITIRAGAVWLQDGVRDDASAARARSAGLDVVMDDCMMRRHAEVRRP